VFVEDLGSTNGTYVNRNKVDATVALHPGDYLQIGRTVMEVMA
jgi:pSer/pThr/pTyr-binding forkhead associated (FHA) protein